MSEANARQLFRNAAAVCFDVDSTVSAEEGIDVLAGFAGRAAEVVELTSRAMGGAMSFEDALAARLNIIRPSYKMIHDCLAAHPVKLSPKVSELIQKLHDRGTYVFLISGGFHQMIHPVADAVSVPYHRIFANSIMFTGPDGRGEYSGYDTKQFTCRDGGKARAVQHIKDEFGVTGSIVVVGDGITDVQAKPPADVVIGYGGIVVRDAVKEQADWFVEDFQVLIDELA